MFLLEWSDAINTDLEQIHKYYRDEVADGEEVGLEVLRRIYLATRQLERLPFTGRPGRISGTKELVVKDTPYIVYYAVTGNIVNLLRVIHSARLLQIAFYEVLS